MAVSVPDLTKQSGFVFEGTVCRTGAVSSAGIEAASTAMVVRVDRVLKGPEVLRHFAGREITVAVAHEQEQTSAGTRAVFFTNGLRYGEGLAVREVGRLDAKGHEVEREVGEAVKHADDEQLLDRLRNARLVVTGVVIHTEPAGRSERVGSEHDPDWWECVIEVESVEKGTVKQEKGKKTRITAYFANSTDIAWYRTPKVKVGDSGIFILHEGEIRSRQTPGPAMIHALDFRPMSEVERVRGLVRRTE